MGSGAARQEEQEVEVQELSPQVNTAIARALERLDASNPLFKESRTEERDSQLTKQWNKTCREIDGYLRGLMQVMIATHQLSLDQGSDGGGRNQRPWLEETTGAIDRLYIKLDGIEAVAYTGDTELLRGPVTRMSYGWVEEAVVNWVLTAVDQRLGGG